ncbi:hypothetical protein F4780DRAFT_99578 [Xylariomycetidae sp. FL0641]|nr:hypothetical protein F4780DRAFT_99578 [Xylariomycetidae sp. FL0641]
MARAVAQCGDDDWPFCNEGARGFLGTVCCQKGATCMTLAGNTSTLCCPAGEKCDHLNSIPCDASLQRQFQGQDPPQIWTSELDGSLPSCGSACCPFGYHCGVDSTCFLNDDQSKKPSQSDLTSATPHSTTSSTSTTDSTASTDVTATTDSSTDIAATTQTSTVIANASASSLDVQVASQSPTSSGEAGVSHAALSTPATIGVAVGAFGAVAIVGTLLFLWYRRIRKTNAAAQERLRQSVMGYAAVGQSEHRAEKQPDTSGFTRPSRRARELETNAVYELQ